MIHQSYDITHFKLRDDRRRRGRRAGFVRRVDRLAVRAGFDSDACLAALLGSPDNGRWKIAPRDEQARVNHKYRPNTLILETRFETLALFSKILQKVMIVFVRNLDCLVPFNFCVLNFGFRALAVFGVRACPNAGGRPPHRALRLPAIRPRCWH